MYLPLKPVENSSGAQQLAQELASADYIPGIDLPSEGNKKPRLEAVEANDTTASEDPDADFDEEADRLFGEDSESEEESEEEEEEGQGQETQAGQEEALSIETEPKAAEEQAAEGYREQSMSEERESWPPQALENGTGAEPVFHSSQGIVNSAMDQPPASAQEAPAELVMQYLR